MIGFLARCLIIGLLLIGAQTISEYLGLSQHWSVTVGFWAGTIGVWIALWDLKGFRA